MAILPIDAGRYGTKEMLAIFDEQRRIDYQVEIEGAVSLFQGKAGIIPRHAGDDISKTAKGARITARRIKQLESRTDHDTAALVQALGEKCSKDSRPWIHYGLTSNDLVDTCNSMQMRDALNLIKPKTAKLAKVLLDLAVQYKTLPAAGRTHGQHASIISFGLKFANWAEEMAEHLRRMREAERRILICKTLGVVGTGSLMGADAVKIQRKVAKMLNLHPITVATQVVPRERYAEYVFLLSLIGATLEKIAVEIRNLQRTEIGEVAEHFKKGQMGSSAVPVKRNPIKSERITSLSRLLRCYVSASFENVPLWHERDLSNSANERFILPTTSILLDAMLDSMNGIMGSLHVDKTQVRKNLQATGGQIFAEFVMEALIKKGIPRMQAYRDVQRVAFLTQDSGTGYADAVLNDAEISSHLSEKEIQDIFLPERHLGASAAIIDSVTKSVGREIKRLS